MPTPGEPDCLLPDSVRGLRLPERGGLVSDRSVVPALALLAPVLRLGEIWYFFEPPLRSASLFPAALEKLLAE